MSKKTIFQKRPKSMVAVNKKLWAACQAWAKRTYEVHPSAYSNSAAVKRYNKMGGKWRKPTDKIKKKAMNIKLNIKESDIEPPFTMDEALLLAERMGIDLDELETAPDEFLNGLNIELEHRFLTGGDPSDIALIALDHLRENPRYYTELLKMEGEGHSAEPEEEPVPSSLDEESQLIAEFFGVAHHEAIERLCDMLESGEQPESSANLSADDGAHVGEGLDDSLEDFIRTPNNSNRESLLKACKDFGQQWFSENEKVASTLDFAIGSLRKSGMGRHHSFSWVDADIAREHEEVMRTAEENNLSPTAVERAFKHAKTVKLTDSLWESLENTDSWETTSLEKAAALAESYGRDWESIVDGLTSGAEIPRPLVLKKKDGSLALVAGNTRLMVMRALGIRPEVTLATLT
jgi:hypothetical protein